MPTLRKLVSSTGLLVNPTVQVNGPDTAEDNVSSKLRKPLKPPKPIEKPVATSASHPSSFIQGLAKKMRGPALHTPKVKPLDNFTRWDAVPSNVASTSNPVERTKKRFSWRRSAANSTASFSTSSTLSRASTFSESSRLRGVQSGSDSSGDSRPTFAIADLDWSQMNDEELSSLKASFNKCIFDRPSPVDSAMNISFDDVAPGKGKGKARVVTHAMGRTDDDDKRTYEAELFDDEHALSEHYRQVQDLERQQDEDDHEYALELQRQEELRIRLQREEEERERLQREEEDRIEAERLQEEERRLAEELARSLEVECVCCGTSKPPVDYYLMTASASCEHGIETCIECTQTWLASELESNGIDGLKCPQCPNKLEHADVQRNASAETFIVYEKFLTRAALDAIPDFTWCMRAGCGFGQVNEHNENYMQCHACKYEQCVKHQCAWHTNEGCDAYDYRESGRKARDDERATAAMLDTVSKKCPGVNCGWRIQKTEGCDHMTCRRCRHEFCWQCLAAHSEIKRIGNTAHLRDCKFHSDNLTASWPFNVH